MGQNDDYNEYKEQYDDLEYELDWNQEGNENDRWSPEEEAQHLDEMARVTAMEREGREVAREDWGDEADDGHDQQIQKLEDREQLAHNQAEHLRGNYDYTRPMSENHFSEDDEEVDMDIIEDDEDDDKN